MLGDSQTGQCLTCTTSHDQLAPLPCCVKTFRGGLEGLLLMGTQNIGLTLSNVGVISTGYKGFPINWRTAKSIECDATYRAC